MQKMVESEQRHQRRPSLSQAVWALAFVIAVIVVGIRQKVGMTAPLAMGAIGGLLEQSRVLSVIIEALSLISPLFAILYAATGFAFRREAHVPSAD